MTYPRVYQTGKPKTFENIDKEATEARKNRAVPTEKEIEALLSKADKLDTEFFQLRAKAIIGLEKVYGKRRAELSLLKTTDLLIEGPMLYVTFTICKKSKKGLFQYFKYLKKQGNPELLNKPLPILEAECKDWNLTPEGSRTKEYRRQKVTPTSDKYAKLIIDYWEFVKETYPKSKFLFPSGISCFGSSWIVNNDKALSGRQLLNIVEELDPLCWMHLFRKLKGSEVARKYGRTLDSAFAVKETLDLERIETAMHYIEEFVPKLETGETH